MRILLIGNFAPDRQESMLRFARLLERGLQERGHVVETWSPEPVAVRWLPSYRYGGAAKFFGYFDKFTAFPHRVRRQLSAATAEGREPDVVHILDHANAVYAPLFARLPLLTTCHDLLQIRAALGEFPQHRVSALGRRYQRWILRHLSRLPHVACVSAKTRDDLLRLAHLPEENVEVVLNGLNHPYRPLPRDEASAVASLMLRERSLAPEALALGKRGFLLNVGGGQWYKNRAGLLDLYAALRTQLQPVPRLVMVGKPLAPDLVERAAALGIAGDLLHLSNVSENQLQALYSLAAGLIFPSWHEGFGWPVAEAQACGCPVFTSDRAPLTEVGGDAAVYLDPANPTDAARRIAAAWDRRQELSARGLRRAAAWQPHAMIDRYLESYAGIAAAPAPLSHHEAAPRHRYA